MRATFLFGLAAAALAIVPAAGADTGSERALAERYAPVVRLVEHSGDCGEGKPYVPIDVDALFGEPTVALRGPWSGADLVKIGPTANDLSKGLFEYHLDFPGNALHPGCTYLEWERRITAGREPTAYAHVVPTPTHPGKLALQYWFFYVFNDWNNLHEGDWEMIQLVFDASTAEEALDGKPVEIGYSQHEGAERATWGDDKLELVDGTHPVVHPADGSHANFFGEALYIGSSAKEGVGCDDTRGPTLDIRPVVRTIPSGATAARADFPWIGFEGRWGELQPAFFNGPEGPNLKTQWTHPITWAEDWRDRSYTVPGGSLFGGERDGLLLRRRRARVEVARPARREPGRVQPRPRSARPPRPLSPHADELAPRGAAPPRAPALVGADPLGVRADVRGAVRPVRRAGRPLRADRVARDAPAGARPARDERARRAERRRAAAACSRTSSSRSARR